MGSNSVQLGLKGKQLTSDKTVQSSLYFMLLIKPRSYILVVYLSYKMTETWSIINAKISLLIYTTLIIH